MSWGCRAAKIVFVVGLIVSVLAQAGHAKNSIQHKKTSERKEDSALPAAKVISSTNGPPYVSAYGEYRYAAVSTDTNACSKIGADILARKSGSAVDSAIATMLCVGVVNAHSSGIGGGHFMTIYDTPRGQDEKINVTIIARETAPGAAHRDMYINNSMAAQAGGLAIAVPGEIMGFYEAWKIFGRVPWSDLFQPTIDLCQNGFVVEPSLAQAIAEREADIRADPNLSEIFVKPDGTLYKAGDTMTRHKLATTLRRISADPFDFYNGSLAEDIVADIKDYGGILELRDLNNYEAKVKAPLAIHLDNGNFTVFGVPPPSSGAVYQFILNILDGYNFRSSDMEDMSWKGLVYHRIAEAFKFGFARRSDLGDEDFVNITELLANLTSENYADGIRSMINDTHTQDMDYYGPSFDVANNSGTAHASVISASGGIVAITSTINLYFGSKTCGNRTGIIFNDEMDDFSIPGTHNYFGVPSSPTNYVEPGKRPMSSMCPTVILDADGHAVLATGASGGTKIITGTALVTMQNLWFGLRLDHATNAARFHHQLIPNQIEYEQHFEPFLINDLEARGHVTVYEGAVGIVPSVKNTCYKSAANPDSCIQASADGRKGGAPDGY